MRRKSPTAGLPHPSAIPGTALFANGGKRFGRNHFLRLSNCSLHPRLSPFMLAKLAFRLPCYVLRSVPIDSLFSLLPPMPLTLPPVARLPALRGMHPSRQRYPMLSVRLLSSSGLPRFRPWPLPCLLRLFFSASAEVKEKTNPRKRDRRNHHENEHEFNPQQIQ
jgi:hypothetical protein